MRVIDLSTGPIGDEKPHRWYFGCGNGSLALAGGKPIGLVYDDPHPGAPTELPADRDEVLRGMVSSWEFCVM